MLDWYIALSGGLVTAKSYVYEDNISNYGNLSFYPREGKGMVYPVPLAVGIKFSHNNWQFKGEGSFNALFIPFKSDAMSAKELGQVKVAAGYKIVNLFVVSVIGGCHFTSINQMNTKADIESDREQKGVHWFEMHTDDKNTRYNAGVISTFFVGAEGEIALKSNMHLIVSYQFGLNGSHDKDKSIHFVPKENIEGLNMIDKGVSMPPVKVNISASLNHRVTIGVSLSGGLL